MTKKFLLFILIASAIYMLSLTGSGCAQVGMPTGGIKDSLPPNLVKANPEPKATNFKGNRVVLTFDEYVDIQEVQKNVLVSPLQKNLPDIRSNLRTVSIRIKDTLKPNTTYSIDFGNAIRDVNEGNIFKNFTYVFSTGNTIDSFRFKGKVLMAETGKADSNMLAVLYRNATDSSFTKTKPDYYARIGGDGSFTFKYLPAGTFRVYALLDGDGNKYYNAKTEVFAFAENDHDIAISDSTENITLYASALEKSQTPVAGGAAKIITSAEKTKAEKRLNLTTSIVQAKQDIISPLQLSFSNPIESFDIEKAFLADTNYKKIDNASIIFDSTRKIASFTNKLVPEAKYVLVVDSAAIHDSLGNHLAKTDTIRFAAKATEDYGRVILRFTGLDLAKHPVLQILDNETIKFSYPLTAPEFTNATFPPGEYGIRILFDDNNNGKWDHGNFSEKLQPEKAMTLPQKLSIRANWDNEREIKL